jgi:hypothetical protein
MMRLLLRVATALVLVSSVAAIVWWHHANGARFELSAFPRGALDRSGCVEELRRFGEGSTSCEQADGHPWYHVIVSNVGGRGAWVSSCSITALDTSGKPIPSLSGVDVPIWLVQPGVGARPYIGPGKSVILDWFLPRTPGSRIGSFAGSCSSVVYRDLPI